MAGLQGDYYPTAEAQEYDENEMDQQSELEEQEATPAEVSAPKRQKRSMSLGQLEKSLSKAEERARRAAAEYEHKQQVLEQRRQEKAQEDQRKVKLAVLKQDMRKTGKDHDKAFKAAFKSRAQQSAPYAHPSTGFRSKSQAPAKSPSSKFRGVFARKASVPGAPTTPRSKTFPFPSSKPMSIAELMGQSAEDNSD
jgi:hypothetical protein